MPDSTATCWGGAGGSTISGVALTGNVVGVEHGIDHTVAQLQFSNVPARLQVYSCSFELTTSAVSDDTTSLTLSPLASNAMATVNRIGNGHFKVGIVNPYGIDMETISLTLTAKYGMSLNEVTFRQLFLNDAPSDDISLTNVITAVAPPKSVIPVSYDLVGAYPNPFNPSTKIVFQTPAPGSLRIELYNSQGARIKVLSDAHFASGRHEVIWDGTNSFGQMVATGQYYCTMRAGAFNKTIRIVLLK